ncbi:DNA-directed RNA polymerase [Aspergillus lucknowensis]|uniref:DNA-directed RNA polymerase n=1 Tax=Aspergillus lucknowensis TaxID=176173 RepID=A0ABR4LUB7_9EURO
MLSQLVRKRNATSHLRLLKGRSSSQSLTNPRRHFQSTRLYQLQSSTANAPQENRPRRPSFQSSRSLATAADHSVVDQQSYLENHSYPSEPQKYPQSSPLFSPRPSPIDPSSLIIIDDFLQTQPKVLRRHKGVGGDENEMMANLDLSLRVGQFDRATSLINRLREFYPIGSPGYLALHNRYLEAMVSHAVLTRQQDLVLQMQRWFEVDMPYGGVQPDSTTFAIMIRMALRMLHGSQRDRSVRRYWAFAKTRGLEEEVLAVPILSELELGELSEICSNDLQRVAIDSMDLREEQNTGQMIVADVTPVRPTEQTGLGLSSLKESISMFSSAIVPVKADPADVESKELYDRRRQQQLENDVMSSALKRWRIEAEKFKKAAPSAQIQGHHLSPILNTWHTDLVAKIKEELILISEAERNPLRTPEQKERCDYGIFLRALEPERLAAFTILSVLDTLIRQGLENGIRLSSLVSKIGNEMYDEILAERSIERQRNASSSASRLKQLKNMLAARKTRDTHSRVMWGNLVRKMEEEKPEAIWSRTIRVKVGAMLMSLLYDIAKVPVVVDPPKEQNGRQTTGMVPAFQHSYQITWGRRSGYIHVHPALVKIVSKDPAIEIMGRRLPMVCKPRPWTGFQDGAYLRHQDCIVRFTPGESLQPKYMRAALEGGGLKEIREALDILGSTGWSINQDVFNVMLEAWNTGDAIADLAPLEPNMPHPPKPSPEEGVVAMRKWHERVRDIENQRAGYHSNRCFQNFQLEVARAYLNETFYLPHNLDFRGRAYPLPPYLNQMGADNARGLLLFSEAKPLGERGLRWLKIQIANLTGFDKASLSEREQFTMDHLDDVLDSANNGLHGRRWWLKAEDPWQCLAACCELRNALQHPVPAEYPSRLPIHQDGSCNGLQHYAALGGDRVGAAQVNLEPSDRPSDVYSGVAEFVKRSITRDAAEGDQVAQALEGKITRKVVKQTVMTNVYGVTFIGAAKQVRKQLEDHYPDLPRELKMQGSLYVTRKIFDALGSMFNGAHDIQYWLGDCASRITRSLSPEQIQAIANDAMGLDVPTKSAQAKIIDPTKEFKSTVIWTTPLGLPVVQPYRTREVRRVSTSFQTLSIVEPNSSFVVSKRKQLQAFPPNFIHSLDATHMIMSARACHKAGLTFSAVHDSFWTHASDVDSMNEILREAFVQMHSDDVIGRLAEEFRVRYGKNLFFARLPVSSKIAREIRTFRKNKKPNRAQELLEEYKRQSLLNSEDPELQAQGRAMVTAGSIFEQLGGTDHDLLIHSTLGQAGAGHVVEDLKGEKQQPCDWQMDASDPAISSLLGDHLDNPLAPEAEPLAHAGSADHGEDTEAGQESEEHAPYVRKQMKREDVWLWLPLRFREVPQKGEWDLRRIRDSAYFFS